MASQFSVIGVDVTTDSSGDATPTCPAFRGFIHAIVYKKTDFANGVDFDIQSASGDELWDEDNVNAAEVQYCRIPANDGVGAAVTFDGSNEIYTVPYNDGAPTITVASGGAAKTGRFEFVIAKS